MEVKIYQGRVAGEGLPINPPSLFGLPVSLRSLALVLGKLKEASSALDQLHAKTLWHMEISETFFHCNVSRATLGIANSCLVREAGPVQEARVCGLGFFQSFIEVLSFSKQDPSDTDHSNVNRIYSKNFFFFFQM